jgi:hypothetical protein
LLEDVAEDVHVDDGADFLRFIGLRHLTGRAEVIIGEVTEKGADSSGTSRVSRPASWAKRPPL